VELERKRRRHVLVRQLLVLQHDIERDGFGSRVMRSLVRRLHDRRPAARADHKLTFAILAWQ